MLGTSMEVFSGRPTLQALTNGNIVFYAFSGGLTLQSQGLCCEFFFLISSILSTSTKLLASYF